MVIRILFFGRHRCHYSERLYHHLIHLGFKVLPIWSRTRGEPLPEDNIWWECDYIFSFRSFFVLPGYLLDQTKIAAINFHPGPPEYPGAGLNFALYEGATQYGVTAHIMKKKLDSGPIIECRRFPILPQDTVTTLLNHTHSKLYDLAIDVMTGLVVCPSFLTDQIEKSKKLQWAPVTHTIGEVDKLQAIDPSCSEEELKRIIRSTDCQDFHPHIDLHGHRFTLEQASS